MNKKSVPPLFLGIVLCVLLCQGLFTSCHKEKVAFFRSIGPDVDTLGCDPGDSVHFSFYSNIGYDRPLVEMIKVRFEIIYEGKVFMTQENDLDHPMNSMGSYYVFKIPDTWTGSFIGRFTAFCDNGTQKSADEVIYLTFKQYSLLMGAQDNPDTAGIFNLRNVKSYRASFASANSNNMDIVYYYDAYYKSCLSSPSDSNLINVVFNGPNPTTWDKRNRTTFRLIKANTYKPKIYIQGGIKEIYDGGGPETTLIRNLSDKQYAFRTEKGVYGILLPRTLSKGPKGTSWIDAFIQK